jgi:hypothetical protein
MPYPNLQNIAPHVWGPNAWKFLHAVALTYPEQPSKEEKQAAFNFFSALEYLLPCENCKLNYRKELQMFPLQPALAGKQQLNEWLTALHNSVSVRLKKTPMTDQQVLQYIFENKDVVHSEKKDTPPQNAPEASSSGSSGSASQPNNNSNNTWAIIATCSAGLLLLAVIILSVLYQQKKVSRK